MSATAVAPSGTHRPFFARDDRQPHRGPSINVGEKERMLSLLAGSALGLYGLSRMSWGGLALAAMGGSLAYRGLSGHCSLYHALNLSTATPRGPSASIAAGHGVKIEERIVVNRDPATLWRFWRNLENLGRFMRHLQLVQQIDERRSRWIAHTAVGIDLQWIAEIINERENELIAWRSIDGSQVDTAGSVHFHPLKDGRGTEVHVSLKYDAHAAQLATPLARLFGAAPRQQIQEDLQRFKQMMESGPGAATHE